MRVDICLPVHNEEQVLEKNCRRLLDFCRAQNFAFNWRIVVVINGSHDRSAEIAARLADLHPELSFVDYPEAGRGQALSRAWLASTADVVSYMDSDLVVDLYCLPDMLNPLLSGAADLSFGSRFRPGAEVRRSLLREIVSQTYNSLAHFFLGHSARDLQCGFKAVSRPVFTKLAPLTTDKHWFFDTELIIWAERLGYRVVEIPVSWQEQRFGKRKSKVKLAQDSLYFIRCLANLRRRLKAKI